jgi:MSHA biogenesis protein MshL
MPVPTGLPKKPNRFVVLVLAFFAVAVMLAGCDLARNQLKLDRSGNKEMQDYRDAMASRLPQPTTDKSAENSGDIPSLQPYVAPPSDNLKAMPLVSISINQTVPLRDALFELAKQANYDIELDPRITGSIIFTAREQPLDVVIQRICDIAGLRYKFDNGVLRVQTDTPYHETYKIDYLSYVRKNTSSISNNISLAQTGGGGSGGATTGSAFSASSDGTADFWGELQTNLQQILGVPIGAGDMKTAQDPQISVVPPSPAPVAAAGVTGTAGTPAKPAAPPQATLQVSSLPPATPGGAAAAPAASTTPSFSLNKQAGIISVYATERQQAQIRDYLKLLRRAVTAQVLIEAKVMEVSLSDEFGSGVNWGEVARLVDRHININAANFPIPAFASPASGLFSIGKISDDINTNTSINARSSAATESAVIAAVSRFGVVKALASPRLTVLNNQSAVLDVALNTVYFSVTATVTPGTTTTAGTTNITSTAHSVPEGVLINVQPSIDLERHTISMSVRPTVTRIVDSKNDPGVDLLNIPNVHSPVPEVNIQEMDSVINMNSGQAVLMGGLMQDRTDSQKTGVPLLSEVPLVGAAFSSHGDKIVKTELVILLKATIVDEGDSRLDDTDHDIYKTFSDDRHPFKL